MGHKLTQEQAADLAREKAVPCPTRAKAPLLPLHKNRDLHTRFHGPECRAVFPPTRLL